MKSWPAQELLLANVRQFKSPRAEAVARLAACCIVAPISGLADSRPIHAVARFPGLLYRCADPRARGLALGYTLSPASRACCVVAPDPRAR